MRSSNNCDFGQQWRIVSACPSCNSLNKKDLGLLPGFSYKFNDEDILFPSEGISVVSCGECEQVYKTVVPSAQILSEIFTRQAGKIWVNKYNYYSEVKMINNLIGKVSFDLLDVGASNGNLLKACADIEGRRSALDVIRHPGLNDNLRGEFIEGLLDDVNLPWSRKPFDIVTLFDVFEHIYNPNYAFKNLRALTKDGGIVFLETGDVESYWPKKIGVNQWWYVCQLEHHIFWSKRSLERIAAIHGFEIIYWSYKRHKSELRNFFLRIPKDSLKLGLYRISSKGYAWLVEAMGKQGIQPCSPFAKDHFQACLRKIPE